MPYGDLPRASYQIKIVVRPPHWTWCNY